MKKSNVILLLAFTFLVIMAGLALFYWNALSENKDLDTDSSMKQNETVSALPTEAVTGAGEKSETEYDEVKTDNEKPIISDSMEDALFIGDSRTVGLAEYAGIKGADFFASVGMSVYDVHKNPVSVPTVGKVTLTELLDNKDYGKIYIMLGINEVGYKYDSTVSKYKELIEFIQEKEPKAFIFIQANVHVTQSRSESDKVVNNKAINELNTRLSELADGKKIFYLDANVLFDDANGNLSSDKAGDSAHLFAKYYSEWGEWIVNQTRLLMEEV